MSTHSPSQPSGRRPPVVECVDLDVVEVLRRKTGPEKLAMVASGWPLLRAMHEFQVRSARPDWDDAAVHVEVSRRMARGST